MAGSELAVIIAGPSGSGKTTAGKALATKLEATFLSKDLLKEAMYDEAWFRTEEDSRRLSAAAMRLLYSVAGVSACPLVVEANWQAVDSEHLEALDRPLVVVLCSASPALRRQRLVERISSGERHPVHRDVINVAVLRQLLSETRRRWRCPLDLDCPSITVDTSVPP
ncbi:MAG TPA: AAA family ATPase, partial [Acidimicrobiales bacterium]|nr:AAA family ATPase [Acidimicrobiales bacterium]